MRLRTTVALLLLGTAVPVLAQETEPAGQPPLRAEEARARRLERADGPARVRYASRPGLHLRIFRDYTLPEGETSAEAIVVVGGDVRIDGEAGSDVTVVGGTLQLGPSAVVTGRLTTIGTETAIASGAQMRGAIDRVAIWWPSVEIGPLAWPGEWAVIRAVLAAARLGFALAVALVLTVVAPRWIRRIAECPLGMSGVIGLTTEVAFVPVMALVSLALVVSVVGIPLLGLMPVVLLLGGVVWAAGFAGVAARIGGLERAPEASRLAPAGRLLRGYLVVVSATVAGHLLLLGPDWLHTTAEWVRATGLVVEYVAWTIGLGAGLASLFAWRRRTSLPPPVPA